MPSSPSWSVLKDAFSSKFVIIICIFICTYVAWTQYTITSFELTEYATEGYDDLTLQALKNVRRDLRFVEIYRKKTHLPKDMKYILLWTSADYAPFYNFGIGQEQFIRNNCSLINCYVTDDKTFFGGNNITEFHAIAFNGRNIDGKDLPTTRAPHQKYIYVNTESADNYLHCEDFFDGFFNWTFTVRLDSDISNPYFAIKNPVGKIVGPRIGMKWKKGYYDISSDNNFTSTLKNRKKAAAWFVSNCASRSKRERFVDELRNKLRAYELDIDVYGSCGTLKCPRDNNSECHRMLERDYFFYMSLENSFARDYVTEKVLTAVQHNVIPIVWGGADYSRFLPPDSYIDGRTTTPEKLAYKMYMLMRSPTKYMKYFTWKKYYSYEWQKDTICDLCSRLNDKKKFEKYESYDHFRDWWNERKC